MGTKKVGFLSSPQKRTIVLISKRTRACKEHELTDNMKGIKILDKRTQKRGKMKNSIRIVSIALFLSAYMMLVSCGQKKDEVEKILEDGVEVVVNHLEPYKIEGEPSTFTLKEEFVIDLERDDLAEIGLTKIHDIAVDSTGNIFFSDSHSKENLIFKFDDEGNRVKSFCHKGQGPGELLSAPMMMFTEDDKLAAYSRMKFLFFEPDGSLFIKIKINVNTIQAKYLNNGNYLFGILRYSEEDSEEGVVIQILYDSQFNEIKELERIELPSPFSQRIKGIHHNLVAEVSIGKIFTGSQQRDYEIYVYDFNGNLIKKIRKEYRKISPSEEYKERFLESWKRTDFYEAMKKKTYFPAFLPPFHYFLTDENGRLYVMTYEKGVNPGEWMFDIFNPEGIFVGRKSLKDFSSHQGLNGKIRNDHFYFIEEKESGFQQVVVYKMKWE